MAADYDLVPAELAELPGFESDDLLAAWNVFLHSCRAASKNVPPLRAAVAASEANIAFCRELADAPPINTQSAARKAIVANFDAWRIKPRKEAGFVTGYFEPEIEGSLVESPDFTAPIFGLPNDLHRAPPNAAGVVVASKVDASGMLIEYSDRAEIDTLGLAGRAEPVVYLRDHVDAFIVHVQGSARVKLGDGSTMRLVYAGRNGLPYSSIGKMVLAAGAIQPDEMSLARLKAFLRSEPHGGRFWMHRNRSYIFFRRDDVADAHEGPVGGAGVRLAALRSIAIDRTVWPYGHFFWLDADLPWRTDLVEPFRRLMVAQDTGSAIIGPARADIFFGSGEFAGESAGQIRHGAQLYILLPKTMAVP